MQTPPPSIDLPHWPRLGLAALFSSVLATSLSGCCFDSTCGCDGPTTVEDSHLVVAPATDVAAANPNAQGEIAVEDCAALCDEDLGEVVGCRDLGPVDMGGGSHRVECLVEDTLYCEGRRHAAVDGELVSRGPSEVAAWLSRMASAEAASVSAFIALLEELHVHGAPPHLLARAEAAATDEVRHAQTIRTFAERAGAEPVRGYPPAQPCHRGLFELALENAIEGCVYEAFSGMLALCQSRFAATADFRRAMTTVAEEEIGHGELAWAIHHWACAQLSSAEVDAIEAAMRDAAHKLVASLHHDGLAPSTRVALGLPAPALSVQMADRLREHLWS